uniref:Cysteine-rich protein n=1 Tax=Spironucleus salmonicida TaxID=348837 RepID=V6LQV4_9EUKA|eukprot:EST43134.1 Hypothetical protein SS50377_17219 [Spironucleus salmonicida]
MIQNYTKCLGSKYVQCKQGFYHINNIDTPNTCIAGAGSGQCAVGNYCPSVPSQILVLCQVCTESSPIACNCGATENSTICNQAGSGCQLYLLGFSLVEERTLRHKLCDFESSSIQCSSGYFYSGAFQILVRFSKISKSRHCATAMETYYNFTKSARITFTVTVFNGIRWLWEHAYQTCATKLVRMKHVSMYIFAPRESNLTICVKSPLIHKQSPTISVPLLTAPRTDDLQIHREHVCQVLKLFH